MNKPQNTRIAAYGLIHDERQILLCRISKEIPEWQGYWTLPGGKIEFGESPEEAMIREVKEETGLSVVAKSVEAIDSFVDLSGEEDHHGIRIIFNTEISGGELRDELSGSTDRCAWHEIHPAKKLNLVDLAQVGVDCVQKKLK